MIPLKTFSVVARELKPFWKEQLMPMYLIERYIPGAKELAATELKEIARQSLSVQSQIEASIQ